MVCEILEQHFFFFSFLEKIQSEKSGFSHERVLLFFVNDKTAILCT